jgi:glycosyltransferase involved in cell wall biosynthesis
MHKRLRNCLPHSYYLAKKELNQTIRRYKSRLGDKGFLSRQLEQSGFEGILIYETECASTQYRVNHAKDCFQSLGFSTSLLSLHQLDKCNNFGFLKTVQFLFLHRIPLTVSLKALLKACKSASIPVIFDLDDAIHDFEVYRYSAVFDLLSNLEKTIHFKMTQKIRDTMSRCDCFTVSTSVLSDYLSKTGKPVFTIPNRVSPEMLRIGETCASNQLASQPAIGYVSGTETHQRDFSMICGSLNNVFNRCPEARLFIAGHLSVPNECASKFSDRIVFVPFRPWPEFLRSYSGITVNLAPLESDNPFCMAKSGVKFLEAALSKVPTIATPIADFRRLINHDDNGFLADNSERWTELVKYCIDNPDLAKKTGIRAHHHVKETQMVSANLEIWKRCFSNLGVLT